MDNYLQLIERISKSSNLPIEELERKVEAKRAKLSHLVSKEGAAQIIAAELGINFDDEKMKISELVQGMKKVNVIGKIIQLGPIREFNKNNRQGKVANLTIADETSNCRVVLWDTHHIELIEKNKLKQGDIIEISGANLRNNEIHLSSFGDIKQSKEKIKDVVETQVFPNKKLNQIQPGQTIQTRAVIVQTFEPRYFEVHPETGKKLTEEDRQNPKIKPVKRALLSIVLDDGTETIRSVLFGEQINQLGLTNEQIFSLEEFNKIKLSLLGEEKFFAGQVRNNQLYNTTDFIIQQVSPVDPQELIKQLENKNS